MAVRVALALLVLIAVGVGALLAFLPGLVESPAVRERIEQAAQDATGREFRYQALAFGLVPPRLVVEAPSLAGEAPGDPAFLEAGEVSLRIAIWPLLARSVVLESLVVRDATVRLVRDESGLRLPGPPAGAEQPVEPETEPGAEPEPEAGPVSLAVQELALRNARIVLEDRTVSPAASWDVQELDAKATFAMGEPVEFEASARVGGGGLRLGGRADLVAETAELEATLDAVGLALLAPYLPERRELSGALSGTVSASGAFAAPDLKADLRLAEGVVRISDVNLQGPLRLAADLAGGERMSGRFDVDATEAELDAYDGAFRKPAGRPGKVTGRFVPKEGGGLTIDDVEVKIHNLDARGRIETDAAGNARAELSAPPIDLAGWDAILPALAPYRPSGILKPGTLRLASEPLSVRGRIDLQGVRLTIPADSGTRAGAGPGSDIGLDGALEGTGDALALLDLVLTTGAERVTLAGEVAGLSQPQRSYRIALGSDGAEANTLLSAFTAVDDRMYGPLFLDTNLTGRTGDPKLESLSGRMSFAIRPGRLKGVSLLEKTVGRLGSFGEAAMLVASLEQPERMKKMERFYGDDFQELAGTFDVAKGWARTRDLRLVYDSYRVDLRGGIRLHDRALDFSGTLTMDREVDETLADASGAAAGGAERQRVIELAEVKGTLDSPEVDLSSRTVRAWAGGYAGEKVRDKYQEKLDEKLGGELGGEVGDLVEGLFGGRKKR